MTRDEARERAERLYASASESTICDAIARALLLAQAEAYEDVRNVIAACGREGIDGYMASRVATLRREAEETDA
jgi:hypothetical protein